MDRRMGVFVYVHKPSCMAYLFRRAHHLRMHVHSTKYSAFYFFALVHFFCLPSFSVADATDIILHMRTILRYTDKRSYVFAYEGYYVQ